jgi:hypothetical protein
MDPGNLYPVGTAVTDIRPAGDGRDAPWSAGAVAQAARAA